MNAEPINRQLVHDRGRALHFRRIGNGPPVVLLHESPRSSVALMPLATRIAKEFTVFALDTPGYGLSDPLPMDRPTIDDFADAVARSLRAAGLSRVPVYGTHTGATIAAAMGVRHPDLVSGLVLDGYPVFSGFERDLHESFYLPEFSPRWDGSHIVSLWSRVRDQFDFFPWYLRGQCSRLPAPKPGIERHRAVFDDFLCSGPAYAIAYSASFRFDLIDTLLAVQTPFHIIARDSDLLRDHLQRLPVLPKGCTAAPAPSRPDPWAAHIASLLRRIPGQLDAPDMSDSCRFQAGGALGLGAGSLFFRIYGAPSERPPLVLIHDSPGSGKLIADMARRHATDRLVIVPELPGHGTSDPLCETGDVAAALVDQIERCVETFDPRDFEIAGSGFGDAVARALTDASPRLWHVGGKPEITVSPQVAPDPPLSERWDGADLLAQWFLLREEELACQSADGPERIVGAAIDRLHARFVAQTLAKGNDAALLAALGIRRIDD